MIITNGKTVMFNSNYLQTIDIDSDNAILIFKVSDINHGQFKVGTIFQNLNSTSFLQQQITMVKENESENFLHLFTKP